MLVSREICSRPATLISPVLATPPSIHPRCSEPLPRSPLSAPNRVFLTLPPASASSSRFTAGGLLRIDAWTRSARTTCAIAKLGNTSPDEHLRTDPQAAIMHNAMRTPPAALALSLARAASLHVQYLLSSACPASRRDSRNGLPPERSVLARRVRHPPPQILSVSVSFSPSTAHGAVSLSHAPEHERRAPRHVSGSALVVRAVPLLAVGRLHSSSPSWLSLDDVHSRPPWLAFAQPGNAPQSPRHWRIECAGHAFMCICTPRTPARRRRASRGIRYACKIRI